MENEKILKEILAAINYQSKLLEEMLTFLDAKKVQNLQGRKILGEVRQKLSRNPILQGNPKAMKLVDDILGGSDEH